MILALVDEAVTSGAREFKACEQLGLSVRSVQRWRAADIGDDRRYGPKTRPKNRLAARERDAVLATVNTPSFRDLSPHQIVPRLADEGRYLASEATIYRLLRAAGQLAHRGRALAPTHSAPQEHVATGPNEVWSWDITYLPTLIRGCFFYLYLILDIYSRRIMGWTVQAAESAEHAAALFRVTCEDEHIDPHGLVLRSDNGGPMRGSTLLATLQWLGIVTSFSRPATSSDNPFSEALFRTLKYRPTWPAKPFASIEKARDWVASFVAWYNNEHRHSALRFVTPNERHDGREGAILAHRTRVYEKARRRRHERWSGTIRNWTPVGPVRLGPRDSCKTIASSRREVLAA